MLARHIQLGRMASTSRAALRRTAAIQQHMSSSASIRSAPDEAPVQFRADGSLRTYILNRPAKLNALNEPMLNLLRPKIEEWSRGDLVSVIAGHSVGRAFCAGGDVESVVEAAQKPETLHKAIDFFHREFELDYILAAMSKPYIAVMDGITMGGGVGLAVNAPFRIATENTLLAMPETKIGYCPDVGASHFLSRVDGQIGTYLGLTSERLKGRAVFEHGFATHYVPSRRITDMLQRIAAQDRPTYSQINSLIEEHSEEATSDTLTSPIVGPIRVALDSSFGHGSVEEILAELKSLSASSEDDSVRQWAQKTLDALTMRSPTSLKVALAAVRKGRDMSFLEALQMEMNIATAFCHGVSPDFRTGVTAVLVEKTDTRPAWSPSTVEEVDDAWVQQEFFSTYTPETGTAPQLTLPEHLAHHAEIVDTMQYALPSEEEIGQMVDGSHKTSGDIAITLDELVGKFTALKKGKAGLRGKILEVVQRRCTTESDQYSDKAWLKWKR